MTCEHLNKLEKELIAQNIKELTRGQVWSKNCREWVYFDCLFSDLDFTIKRFNLNTDVIKKHAHLGTHDGQEYGLVCSECKDGIMGYHPEGQKKDPITFK